MKLHVEHYGYCEDSYHDGEKYGSWSESNSHSIKGVCLEVFGSAYNYETFGVDYEVERGDVVFVVTMVYSTGDSFGHATGKHEVMWVFKDPKLAHENAKTFKESGDDYTVNIKTESGKTVQLGNPAFSYFDSIENVEVTSHVVT